MSTGLLHQDARLYVCFANKRIAIGHRDDFIKYHQCVRVCPIKNIQSLIRFFAYSLFI